MESEKMEKERGLRYFPIALFASVMGLAGTTFAIKQYENMYSVNNVVSTIIFSITIAMCIIVTGIFLYRLIRYPNDTKEELNHPVKTNFFGAIAIRFLILRLVVYAMTDTISFVLWLIGRNSTSFLTSLMRSELKRKPTLKMKQWNPLWSISLVGESVVG